MDMIVSRHPRLGAVIDWGAGARRCAIGRAGIAKKLREGDGVTPLGTYPLRRVLYRPDRVAPPRTMLPLAEIVATDAWCDGPGDPAYNHPVTRPYAGHNETLWRDDALYDNVAVIGFNDEPVLPGKGSAIFLHVARSDFGTTDGCVALTLCDLRDALNAVAPGDRIQIRG